MARGLTNRRIAEELSLSEHTVEKHVRRVLTKLKFRSRTQIAAWVMGYFYDGHVRNVSAVREAGALSTARKVASFEAGVHKTTHYSF